MVGIVQDIEGMNDAEQGTKAGAVRARRRRTRHKRLLQLVQHTETLFRLLEPHVLAASNVTVRPSAVPLHKRLLQLVQHTETLFRLLEPHVLAASNVTVRPSAVPLHLPVPTISFKGHFPSRTLIVHPQSLLGWPSCSRVARRANGERERADAGCDADIRSLGSTAEDGDPVGPRAAVRAPATPADSPRHDCIPYSPVHVRRERVGFVHRSRAIFCRPVQT
jgi:hypothetical protein